MRHKIEIVIQNVENMEIELDDSNSPNTVKKFVENLPFTVGMNLWGEEIYTDESPIKEKDEIKPYSPVNVIGKILKPEKSVLEKISDGLEATFQLKK